MLPVVIAALGVTLFVVGSMQHPGSARITPRRAAPQPRASVSAAAVRTQPPAHIAVIVMENESYGDVIGSRSAPFINRLARRYAVAREMFAVGHPSLPNYLALTGGSTFGISSDCTGCAVNATGLPDQLQSAGVSWKAYMEGLPRPCFTGPGSGDYAKKHDPFLYYTQIAQDPAVCSQVVPLAQLGSDERSETLPRFVWITPNLCHDMHDCSVRTGDRFLSRLVPRLLRALAPNGILFLTWDEGSSDSGCCGMAAGGHVATIVAGPGVRAGARLNTQTDDYSVLQTIEDLLGLPRLRGAACPCTASLKPLLADS
jgi:hypothetical protein